MVPFCARSLSSIGSLAEMSGSFQYAPISEEVARRSGRHCLAEAAGSESLAKKTGSDHQPPYAEALVGRERVEPVGAKRASGVPHSGSGGVARRVSKGSGVVA